MMENNKKKVALICNNFGKTYDGIGAYSEVEYNFLKEKFIFKIYTANCLQSASKIHKVLCKGMISKFKEFYHDADEGQFDTVIIEYPFVEWNPLIVFWIKKLHRLSIKKGFTIISSIHEFDRVNILRKIVIKSLAKNSHKIFVTTEDMGKALSKYCSEYVIREIPSNIILAPIDETLDARDQNKYVFFGMVNHSKAFYEMLNGWDAFVNDHPEKTLYIISSSSIDEILNGHKNIIYLRNANEENISEVMQKCAFSLLPIKPLIDMKNATFKTSMVMGNICIGVFCKEYESCDFVFNMNSYEPLEFNKAFLKSTSLSYEELCEKSLKSREYGKKFDPHFTFNKIAHKL